MIGWKAKNSSQKIARNFSIYFFSNAIDRALPFFLLPILTRYLLPEDFAKIAIFAAALTFIGPLVHLALYSFLTVEFFKQKKGYISSMISAILPIVFFNALLLTVFFFVSYKIWGDFLGLPMIYYLLIPLVAFLYNVKAINLLILRNDSKPGLFGLYNILSTIIYVLLSLLFVVGLGKNWEGRVFAEIITAGILMMAGIAQLRKGGYLNLKISPQIIKENFKFSMPMIPGLFAISLINQVDRFFIKEIVGESELGMYAIGSSFGMMVVFILYSFEQILIPTIYKKLSDTENSTKNSLQLSQFTKLYSLIVLLFAGGVTVGSYLLFELNFLPKEYFPVRQFISWIALAYALRGMCTILTPYISFSKKTKFLLISAIIGCIVNLIANYYLIHQYGAIGAAYSKVITFAVILVLYWFFGTRLTPIPWLSKDSFRFSKDELLEFLK